MLVRGESPLVVVGEESVRLGKQQQQQGTLHNAAVLTTWRSSDKMVDLKSPTITGNGFYRLQVLYLRFVVSLSGNLRSFTSLYLTCRVLRLGLFFYSCIDETTINISKSVTAVFLVGLHDISGKYLIQLLILALWKQTVKSSQLAALYIILQLRTLPTP